MRLETSRLSLNLVQFTDSNDVLMAVKESVGELSTWFPWATAQYTVRDAQDFIAEGVKANQAKTEFVYVIRSKSSGRLMGVGSLRHVPDEYGQTVPMYELGYWMRSSETGQGFGTEAVQKMVEFAMGELGAVRVFGCCAASNLASQKTLEAAQLVREAVLNKARKLPNGQVDGTVVFAKTV